MDACLLIVNKLGKIIHNQIFHVISFIHKRLLQQ